GTPITIAPEVAAGAAPTPASDWYAVGVMLYEALTGAPPFVGTAEEILRSKQHTSPLPVRERAPNAPVDLAELCDRLLDRDPQKRTPIADGLEAP
ncbi:protein kinase domain-containing protein, partial [Enterococcus faecium]|uniref:protein kinase domain-containing protein n=1 Tax=Enterococcus faecium TaxID=1352 RepID=UPI003907EBDA